ncbi:hypothetical protein B0H14DRAFT_3889484, partial [Mycena olivaceomarginata]
MRAHARRSHSRPHSTSRLPSRGTGISGTSDTTRPFLTRGVNRSDGDRSVPAIARGATNASATVRTRDVIKIVYWNIYRHLTLKLMSDEFHAILKQYD